MIGTGRIHVYYGDGKGKTTAAMGLVLRAGKWSGCSDVPVFKRQLFQ